MCHFWGPDMLCTVHVQRGDHQWAIYIFCIGPLDKRSSNVVKSLRLDVYNSREWTIISCRTCSQFGFDVKAILNYVPRTTDHIHPTPSLVKISEKG
jgi:hypothetical protein